MSLSVSISFINQSINLPDSWINAESESTSTLLKTSTRRSHGRQEENVQSVASFHRWTEERKRGDNSVCCHVCKMIMSSEGVDTCIVTENKYPAIIMLVPQRQTFSLTKKTWMKMNAAQIFSLFNPLSVMTDRLLLKLSGYSQLNSSAHQLSASKTLSHLVHREGTWVKKGWLTVIMQSQNLYKTIRELTENWTDEQNWWWHWHP